MTIWQGKEVKNMERYIDPNSGAAPQPGGSAAVRVAEDAEDPNEEHPAGNVTLPEDANSTPEENSDDAPQDQGVEELPDELVKSQSYDTEIQNQAAPAGPHPGVEDRDDSAALTEESEEAGFDPSEHNVEEVVTYVQGNPDEKDAIVEKEKAGKNRSTLLAKLEE
jgi:hypothetical protein